MAFLPIRLPIGKLFWGQLLLILCCALYLAFWSVGYNPHVSFRMAPKAALFACTALCGAAGVVLAVSGINATEQKPVPQLAIVLAGVGAYVLLLLLSLWIWKRQVTTELALILAWAVLELSTLNALAGAHAWSRPWLVGFAVIVAIAVAGSMVCYLLYYRLPENTAFVVGMVPLILLALVMAGVCCRIAWKAS